MSLKLNDPDGYAGFLGFGWREENHRTMLDNLMAETPAVRPPTAQWLSLQAYDMEYGLFNHHLPHRERPLAVQAMHPQEDAIEGSQHYHYIRKFFYLKIHTRFGLSLTEFFALPYYEAKFLLDIAHADTHQEHKDQTAAHQQMEMAFKGPGISG